MRRIIVEKIEWLDIKETLVLHLLNLAIGGADYLPFASLLVIVKSARLGEKLLSLSFISQKIICAEQH